jgi:hypothetical protein
MSYSFTLIPGGFQITSADGSYHQVQEFDPNLPGFVPYASEAAAQAAAESRIAELTASTPADE